MLFSYKFFTLLQLFSQLPNKFYITKPTTTQHRNHQNATTHTTTTTKKKNQRSKRSSRSAREWSAIKQIGDDQTRFKREREIGGVNWELGATNSTARSCRCVWGWAVAHSPHSLFFLSLSLPFCYVRESSFLSLFLSLRVCEFQKWFEGKIKTEMLLQGQRPYFMVNGNNFPFDPIFLAHPNTRIYGKAFPEMIWSQNKHSLSYKILMDSKGKIILIML